MSRISDSTVRRYILAQLGRGGESIANLRLQIASGVRIRTPSDDVLGAAQALASAAGMHRAEGYGRASDALLLMFDGMEESVKSVTDLLGDARTLAAAAGNDFGDDADGREALAVQVDQLLELAVEATNARTAGRYAWGGTTPSDVPFIAERDADGAIVSVDASAGAGEPLTRFVGDRATTLPVTGPAAFLDGADTFDALIQLRDAIRSGDLADLNGASDALVAAEDAVGTAIASIGSLRARHLASGDRLSAERFRHEANLSRVMDTDIAEAVVRLEAEEASYEAALQMTARMSDLSLLKYL